MALARHQFTVTDEAGNVQASASVRVIDEATGALAALYSDRAGASALGNPFTADTEGFAAFHVVGGAYKIVATKGSFSQTWRYVGIGTAAEFDSDIFINANRTTVRAATTANITIATALNNGDTLDGLTLATNDRVLVKNQTTKSQNGIYVVGATPARSSDFATFDPHAGAIVVVQEGTANALKMFFGAVNAGGDIGTDDIVFAEIAAVAGPAGADGASFQVDATGSFAERTAYDGEAEGFAYLSNDGDGGTITTSVIFIMGAGGSGDWSDAIPFQGPKGDTGATGSTGSTGAAGASAYVYIAYASDGSGTGFSNTFNSSLDYIAVKPTTSPIVSPSASDFTGLWKNYKGATGATGSTGSAGGDGADGALWYSGSADPGGGTGIDGDFYLQVGTGSTGVIGDVWEKISGTWTKGGNIRGASGAGTGDMLAATYDPTSKAADAFAMDNMVEGTNTKILTGAERTKLSNTSGTNTGDQSSVTGNAGTATKLATARNIDGQAFDGSANITVIAPGTHAATGKTTPVDADELPIVDSAASNVLKKVTWANVKATLKTYFDTLYELAGAIATHAALTATHGATGAIVGTTNTQTLTNKTLTSPVINSPTGIVKADVGLSSVDNTSDATKNAAAVTLTNKRHQPRLSSSASGDISPDISAADIYIRTALAAAAAINSPSGTPVQGEKLIFRLKDNGTSRALTWNGIFRAIGVTIPTATTISKTTYVGAVYNSDDTKWDVIAVATEA